MKFNPNNEDFDEEDEEDFDEEIEAEMMADALAQSNKNREQEIELAKMHIKLELMDKAVAICKSNWFWRFMPHAVKLQKMVDAYETLQKLMEN